VKSDFLNWRAVTWGDLAVLRYGKALRTHKEGGGDFRVFGTNGPIGWTEEPMFPPGIVVGRKGAYRGIHYSARPCWVIDTAFYLELLDARLVDVSWAYYQLKTVDLDSMDSGSAIPSTTRDAFATIPAYLPPIHTQRRISSVLRSLDDLIENNRRRIQLLEQMAQAIYREWFVKFRYPGHEHSTFVDSPLGPIPSDWSVLPVANIASTARHAVTSGPFGSKLGRKDYVGFGTPVIRGANLRLGGGFDESDFIFVSAEKCTELRSSLARPGDVIITQRGTLGQVGIIPATSKFAEYVLSQSQMKVTADRTIAAPEFLYAQLRTNETTERFVSQAMSSGVPHVNLALLREFEVLVPTVEVQDKFVATISPSVKTLELLTLQNVALMKVRDMLLPKLVTGQIDVSSLDLDALLEGVA
jgi:type I restriction enzyme, S subunit